MSIFLSYSREDEAIATALETEVERAGLFVYRDPPLLIADPFWRERVAGQLSTSDAMAVLWSSSAAASPWVDQEIRGYSGPILFILLDETPIRQYGSGDSRRRCVKSTNAIVAFQRLLLECHGNAQMGNDAPPPPRRSRAVVDARRRNAQSAHSDLPNLLRRFQRPARFSPTSNCDVVINEWDGTIMQRISTGKKPSVYVATEPVTNGQYETFVRECDLDAVPTWNRSEFRLSALPVVGVTWFEARLYAAWAGGSLPTETEWTRSATLSMPDAVFATSTGAIGQHLAYYECRLGLGSPVVAKQCSVTAGGYHGMCGNTWDWCDCDSDSFPAIKGGGYADSAHFCRISARYRNNPSDRDCTVGFRIKVMDDNE